MAKINVPWFFEAKKKQEKFVMLSLYEAWTAKTASSAGVQIILVGDSVATSVQGHETTFPVTMEDMLYHTRAVRRGAPNAFVISDMPFLSHTVSESEAVRNAGRFLSEASSQAVKVEGGAEIAPVVSKISNAGIPVMGHIGMTPQHFHRIGGYKIQGKTEEDETRLVEDAKALDEAGAFAIVLELVTEEAAAKVTESVSCPTIGIGAGAQVDAQVLVFHDLLGLNVDFKPKFLNRYKELGVEAIAGVKEFVEDVKTGEFPKPENRYHKGKDTQKSA